MVESNFKLIDKTNHEVAGIVTRNKTDIGYDKMLFVRGMLACRVYVETGEKILKNDIYARIYKVVYRIRRKLNIPGSPCDLISRDYMGVYKYIPECLFEKNTKDERLKDIEKMTEKLRGTKDIVTFEKIVGGNTS